MTKMEIEMLLTNITLADFNFANDYVYVDMKLAFK